MKKLPFIPIACLLFFTLLANPKPAQEKKSETQLQHEVIVALKLIQVYVTDKDGNQVKDLTKDDFILYDNGKLQIITDFEKHFLPKLDKNVEEAKPIPPEAPLSRMNRKFFILLDILGNDEVGIIQSKKAALHFIDTQLHAEDEVGILSFTLITGLNIHTYLTTDHKKIRNAIKKAKEVPVGKTPKGPTLEEERQRAEEEANKLGQERRQRAEEEAKLGQESDTSSMWISPFKDPGSGHIKRNPLNLVNEVSEAAKAMKYIPGYKHIIFFSGGAPSRYYQAYKRMGRELASSNCIVYTIDSMGTRAHFKGIWSQSEDTLKIVADVSGGKYFKDVKNYEKISVDIHNITNNYYVLGYYVNEKWDGRYHEIKVEVKRKGCQVSAQAGYFNPKPFTRLSDLEKKLHLIDLALSERPYFQEPLRFSLVTLPYSNKNESNLVLLSEIPIDKIGEVVIEKADIITLILDSQNNIVVSNTVEINFSTLPQKTIFCYTILSLLPGSYACRTVIRNQKTGKGAVASSYVNIPRPLDSGLRLYPPLLLIPEGESFYLKLSKGQIKEGEEKPLSLINIYPFLSNEYSPLVEELTIETSMLLAVLRCSIIDIPEPDINVSVYLVENKSGKKVSLSLSILASESKEETDILLIELQLPELLPGKYSLEIIAEEITSNSSSQVTRTFIVK